MYAALWRRLPGPTPIKALEALVLLLLVVLVLFQWVFPWLLPQAPLSDVSLEVAAVGAGLG